VRRFLPSARRVLVHPQLGRVLALVAARLTWSAVGS
jgi:hypothetical protein